MARKPYVFSQNVLRTGRISEIIDLAVKYDAKLKNKSVSTRDTLRADMLIKALISISEESFKTKTTISNKLIDALLSRDERVTEAVNSCLLTLGGYKYDDINNMVYYLSWFACTDIDPEYSTLDEFVEHLEQ